MDETQLRLDGNAAAGILRDLFVHELTSAQGACAGCGTVAALGSHHLYSYPLSPGAVLRCSSCDSVLLVVVHAGGRYRLGLSGLTWLEMSDAAGVTGEP